MKINFHGNACFTIKEGDFTMATDPHDKLKEPLLAGAVTVSNKDPGHSHLEGISGEPKVFNWPGEYETGGVHMKGIATFHNAKEDTEQKENTVFKIEMNGIHLCHLGALGTKLTPEQLEQIGDVDILFIPVGGEESIDTKKAKEVIEQIEPRIVIPMTYCVDDDQCGLGPLQPFLSEMGAQNVEPLDEFTLKRSELPDDSSKIVVLNQK